MAGGHRVHRRRAQEPEREAVAQAAQGPPEGGLGVGSNQACAAWCEEGSGEAVREWGWVDAVLVSVSTFTSNASVKADVLRLRLTGGSRR